MSVALLNWKKEVEISDELEAFLHVIVYYSTRYLRSNLTSRQVGDFIDEYFYIFTVYDNTWSCGERKERTLIENSLTAEKGIPVTFGSHMDQVLAVLLSWFHSKLIVQIHEFGSRSDVHGPPSPTPAPSFPAPLMTQFFPEELEDASDEDADEDIGISDEDIGDEGGEDKGEEDINITLGRIHIHGPFRSQEPTSQQRANAKLANKHAAMKKVLNLAVKEIWAEDKVGDRFPEEMLVTQVLTYTSIDRTASPYA